MRFFRQWIVWRFEETEGPKPTKVPYSPLFNGHASVTNPQSWGSYEDAIGAFNAGGWDGLGFVFTDNDPYAGIDLDDAGDDAESYQRQVKIYNEFDSYAELSPSGKGLHIIVKGSVPRGRRRSKIEVYSSERFFTMTGNVYRDVPIAERGELLNVLWQQMGGPAEIVNYGMDAEEKEDDPTILSRMFEAANGDKARDLYEGRWENYYQSQSEADFAFIDIVAFYTQNRFQITRLFHASALGKRDKAKRVDYVTRMINRAFDRQLPPIDIDALKIAFESMMASNEVPSYTVVNGEAVPPIGGNGASKEGPMNAPASAIDRPGGQSASAPQGMPLQSSIVNPPGLVGAVAEFIFAAAPRPVHEIALAGAIGFVAGIAGRAFNISGTGLNQYVMLLAPTGTGKEAINRGLSKIIAAVQPTTPNAPEFVGPGEIRSDAALLKWVAKFPCIYSIAGEFGLRLKQMSAQNANSHEVGLRRTLLDLYNKSGAGESIGAMAYSDKDKNTAVVNSPSFTMIGESTPERFYEALDESMIYEGLLPRFTFIEYNGKRPPPNEHHATVQVPFALAEDVASLMAHSRQLQQGGKAVNVGYTPEAKALFDQFNAYVDGLLNSDKSREISRQFWTRAHMKALKLAATIAVGINWADPVIDYDCAVWATNLIVKDIENLIGKFDRGEVGDHGLSGDEAKQIKDMIQVIVTFLTGPPGECAKYGMTAEMHSAGIILAASLQRRLFAMASFRKDRLGATNAIKRAIQHLLDGGDIVELPKSQMQSQFGVGGRGFSIARPATFNLKR